ncbi:ATP synthase F0 subcomplex A subunit [Halopolyspora algeriensis]|uniref:ATP synthase subunit a n=1 Tax=Halopolyspora algeriensis TaxID=1500506 RepID=A0A368VTD2_9ACTN|nr:F0F1 ATP synthase subunit A [Halopolyspora algeriensis]RCW45250.1 ATP synthase F0 subcomplex A subunit [Halopolyspora algeriensis]TQM53031.1 ATP synthase F0 subcomplex A subunit [Halopolyspora algeriensis]
MSTPVLAADGGEFQPPGVGSFDFPPIVAGITKPMVLLVLSIIIVGVFFWAALRKSSLVPGKMQFAAESTYDFVRNSIGRDMIGGKDLRPYLPLLVTVFTFILVNNVFGFVPFLQLPTMSNPGVPYGIALIVWLVYNGAGFARHGAVGYLKHQTWPPGVPGWIRPLVTPLEFISNILVRPLTLSLRLFANMFAGHLVLLVFILGGEYLLLHGGVLGMVAGPLALILSIVLMFFELVIQFLQAYIFTMLTASYIGGAVAEEH